MKKAILQVADTGPLESLVVMLRSVGYECFIPDKGLRDEARRIGCDTIVEIENLVKHWGYEHPFPLPLASIADVDRCDLYIDVKAQRSYSKIVSRWPSLYQKVLWYRINGSKPEHVIKINGFDCGDEVNPPCPILTPNQWYKPSDGFAGLVECLADTEEKFSSSYACWPPFVRVDEYPPRSILPNAYPICLIHNLKGWGYGALVDPLGKLGVKFYGVDSPDGLINHSEVKNRLQSCLAYAHLKSNDAPGYALYEALSASCPIICTRRLIWRCKMQDLLIPGKTCLVFDRETHDALDPADVISCTNEVRWHLEKLQDPAFNREIGEAGRKRLLEVMWNDKRESDVSSLRMFMERNFSVKV